MNQFVPHWSHANTLAFGSVRSARWRLLGDEADDEEDGELEEAGDGPDESIAGNMAAVREAGSKGAAPGTPPPAALDVEPSG